MWHLGLVYSITAPWQQINVSGFCGQIERSSLCVYVDTRTSSSNYDTVLSLGCPLILYLQRHMKYSIDNLKETKICNREFTRRPSDCIIYICLIHACVEKMPTRHYCDFFRISHHMDQCGVYSHKKTHERYLGRSNHDALVTCTSSYFKVLSVPRK